MAYNPNPYMNMSVAAALLRPTTNFAQLRADRDRELMLQSAITQQAQAEEQQAQQSNLIASQQLYNVYKQDFLQPDQERWRVMMDGIRQQIGDRVKKDFGGDYARYAKTLYLQDLQNLTQQALTSPLYTKAQNNKLNYARLLADQSKGVIDRPVQYKTIQGVKTASARDNYLDYVSGKTDELVYNGGYEVKPGWQKAITDNYSPKAPNRYVPVKATDTDKYNALVASGMAPEDALDYMNRYGKMIGDIAYKFDARDPYREESLRIQKMNANISRDNLKVNQQRLAQQIKKDNAMGLGTSVNALSLGPQGMLGQARGTVYRPDGSVSAQAVPFSVYQSDFLLPGVKSALRAGKTLTDKATGLQFTPIAPTQKAWVTTPNKAGGNDFREINLTGTRPLVLNFGEVLRNDLEYAEDQAKKEKLRIGDKTKSTNADNYPSTLYAQATVALNEEDARKAGLIKEGTFWGNNDTFAGKGAYETKEIGGKTYYIFPVTLPTKFTEIQRVINNNSNTGRYINSKAGTGDLQEDYEAIGAQIGILDDYNQ